MTFNDFMSKMYEGSSKATDSNIGDQRLGQWFFNFLNHIRPDLASRLRGSMIDPYNKDYISEDVTEFVRLNW